MDIDRHDEETPAPAVAVAPVAVAAPQRAERMTRKRLVLWDRVKLLVLLALVWGFVLWSALATDPLLSVRDAVSTQLRARWWLEALAALELVRQLHFFISEHVAWYHRFWTAGIFGGFEARTHRMRDWTRYRMARAVRVLVVLSGVAMVAGAVLHESPPAAFFELPGRLFRILPFLLQAALLLLLAVGQFAAIFWFMSKGGTDVYFPDDIKTRFSDV